jgi:Asp/Glu/hydantoin racemase
MLTEFVASIGLSDRLAGIRAVAPTGAEIAANPAAAHALIAAECEAAVREDGADIVILGGAGLVGIAGDIAGRVPVPLIDCLAATLGALEGMARLKIRKATVGTLARAPAVETVGLSAELGRALG